MFNITTNVYAYPSPINKWSPVTCNAFIWISNLHLAIHPVQLGEKLSKDLTQNLYTHFKQYFYQLAGQITHFNEPCHEETKYVSLTMLYLIQHFDKKGKLVKIVYCDQLIQTQHLHKTMANDISLYYTGNHQWNSISQTD